MTLVVDGFDKKQFLSTNQPSLLTNKSVCDMTKKVECLVTVQITGIER